jgi:hypothetical protein
MLKQPLGLSVHELLNFCSGVLIKGNVSHLIVNCDVRILPWYKGGLHSSGMLHSVDCVIDVPGYNIDLIFKGQAEGFFLYCPTLEARINKLSRKVDK